MNTIQRVGKAAWDTRYPLDDDEQRVFDVLKRHLGADRPVSRLELAATTGLADRAVRRTIEALRKAHHVPIGAAPGGGYYICIRPEEFQANAAREYQRGRSCMANLAVFLRSESLRAALGQMDIGLGEERR